MTISRGPSRPGFLRNEVLADLFEATAARQPEHAALVFGELRLSYRDLDERANGMAHHLMARGVKPGDIVGLWLPRGVDLLVSQLAIAKTGAAWLPLDVDTPAERVAVCLEDAQAVGIVTGHGLHMPLNAAACPVWDQADLRAQTAPPLLRRHGARPEHPAYVIYTSGSTGKPKGVPISQGAICHFLRSENSVLGVRADDVVYQGFSVAFDMSFEEIWISYLVGASLWIAPREITADPDALPRALVAHGVSVLHAVPTLLALFSVDLPGVRLINLGGEMCPQAVVDRWATPSRRMFNTYGPTEATVSASIAELHAGQAVTIGAPLPNYGLLVVDGALKLLDTGEIGELCIIGPGVAQGYLGRPELTAEKFVANPWMADPAEPRLYRTGDLARLDAQGQVHCLGRVDDQVKVRGFRVELGEIDAQLSQLLNNGTAAVVLKPVNGIDQLVAYVVAGGDAVPTPGDLRLRLRAVLSPYMVPSHFEVVRELPRLTSGKIDRKALRALPMSEVTAPAASDEAENEVEAALFAALARLFPGQSILRTADFFDDLGGHSLLAARLVSTLREDARFVHMTVNDVYRNRQLAAIAEAMQAGMAKLGGAALPEFVAVPRSRRMLCGAVQALALPFMISLNVMNWLAPFFTYHYFTGDAGDSIAAAVLASVLVFLASHLFSLAVAILSSRLVLRGIQPGRYPLWGVTYFRWWLADRLRQIAPAYLLSGSSLYNGYLRAMGAQVGEDVVVGSVTIQLPHLLRIGDGASLGSNVNLANVRVERGELVVGAIDIGAEGYVGSYAVMEGDTAIAPWGRLEGLAALARGGRIAEREVWDGSPARLVRQRQSGERRARPPVTRARRMAESLFFTVGAALTSVLFFLPIFPAFALIDALDGRALTPSLQVHGYVLSVFEYALLALPASAVLIVGTALIAAAIRWTVLPKLRPGTWPVHSNLYCRKWLANQIQVASLHVLHGVYATVYAPVWYRMLGAKIGRHAEISTAMGLIPDMLTLGDESFIADAVMLGDEEVDGGWMSIDYTVIGRRSFVGNGAYVPDGTTLPPDVLIGVQSKAPGSEMMQPGQTWVGSPAISLPSREILRGFPESMTFKPSIWRWIGRALVEALRIVLPLSLIIGAGYVIVQNLMPVAGEEAWLELVLDLGVAGIYYGVGCFLFVVALKWLLIGRYQPRATPMWTPFVWTSEALTSIYEAIAVPNFLEYLRGTPMLPSALRLLGVKIGHDVYIDTTDITEFDCVQIGDRCELNAWSGPQTHLFEDRVMKIGRIQIGDRVTLGTRSTVLYDTVIGNGVLLGPLTLVMKGEKLPPDSAWFGSPAQSWTG
ncbi:amino acid adenylation domain-containing protein [Acidovorax sp. Be4]|uniref:Amino acid adenylation domain-containing protein n=1 Tax=Acidovorax bellezanensis TaxID=2976702 RepID=A0ABT2PM96_9BURK|nr:Pls/PosA family non-ribosomal peptide synthetase [Acidovorax sp. Be4]MCT9810961.1 amino acid adenylation domain-containing protein [Acidovorax sp. Be4]